MRNEEPCRVYYFLNSISDVLVGCCVLTTPWALMCKNISLESRCGGVVRGQHPTEFGYLS